MTNKLTIEEAEDMVKKYASKGKSLDGGSVVLFGKDADIYIIANQLAATMRENERLEWLNKKFIKMLEEHGVCFTTPDNANKELDDEERVHHETFFQERDKND